MQEGGVEVGGERWEGWQCRRLEMGGERLEMGGMAM